MTGKTGLFSVSPSALTAHPRGVASVAGTWLGEDGRMEHVQDSAAHPGRNVTRGVT